MSKISTFNIKHTTRQWNLYKLLENEFIKNPNKYLTLKELYSAMRINYPHDINNYCTLKANAPWNNQKARRDITNDVESLKLSLEPHHNVISNSNGVKIANKEDIKILEREKISLLSSLKRVYFQLGKAQLDGQKRLVFNQETDTIECYK